VAAQAEIEVIPPAVVVGSFSANPGAAVSAIETDLPLDRRLGLAAASEE